MMAGEHESTQPNEALPLASVCATDFVMGAIDVVYDEQGWAYPQRFSPQQRRALTSCLAWHPGLFRQMSQATAGVCLRLRTDATTVAIALRLGSVPSGARMIVNQARAKTKAVARSRRTQSSGSQDNQERLPWEDDGFDMPVAIVDGRRLDVEPTDDIVHLSLVDPRKDPGDGIVALPGLGETHEVTLWLPCLRGCGVRELWADATYVEPMQTRPRLLVLGDALGQGFCCGDPSRSWPALVADALGLDLVNQSVGGQVFQPSTLLDGKAEDVTHVVVALGSHYRTERCDARMIAADVRGTFAEIRRHWPEAQIWAITPAWHDRLTFPEFTGSCFREVPAIIRVAARRRGVWVVDGGRLTSDDNELFAKGTDLLSFRGHEDMATHLLRYMGIDEGRGSA